MPQKGRWQPAGCIVGDGFSVAWRVYDAQYWGTPQRRKRIYLVADFRTERAGEILFEREGLRGHSSPCGTEGEGTAADAERGVGRSDEFIRDGIKCLNPWDSQTIRQYQIDGCYPTLQANSNGGQCRQGVCYPAAFMGGQGAKARSIAYCDDGSTPTLKAAPSGGNTVPDVVYPNVARTLAARADSSPCVDRGQNVVCVQNTGRGWWNQTDVAETLRTPCGGDSTKANLVVYGVDCRSATLDEEKTHTLQAKGSGGISLNCTPSVLYDARGNGDGYTSPCLTGDHENRITDYTCIAVERTDNE